MFTLPFSSFDVRPGDWIVCTVDGTDYTARIERDDTTVPSDFECYSPEQVYEWERGDWCFVGVVIEAKRNGVPLGGWLTGLWGIESDSSPEYFLEVANDLLREAIPLANEARKRIALAMA
jgi:hypothetical protein